MFGKGVFIAVAVMMWGAAATAGKGPVTNLPLPRFVSLKTDEGNARRGPSTAHKVDWVFTRRDMPLEVIGEYGHWRQVRDRDGATGWVHYALLSGVRTVIV
jgi:SH3-like domain-containing protein